MSTNTVTDATGRGFESFGGTLIISDVEVDVTAIDSAKVRQREGIGSSDKLEYAGSYGLLFTDGDKDLVVMWEQIAWSYQDYLRNVETLATGIFWWLNPGVTATLIATAV
jgi:hypothetical protein